MYLGFANPTPDDPVPCGRYELLERIGYGGMAEIFRARLVGPSGFNKTVVIKRILPRLAHDNLVVRMFVEEAKIAAAAHHDNIATVYELGVADDGKFFIVMEYIQGIDLELLLGAASKRSLRVPTWFAVHTISETLEALSYVHGLRDEDGNPRNVIHRDATPSNIFISQLGQVKLSDFGVADYEGKSPTTQAGQLKGKLAYMSPEQLNNKPLDHRADLFTIGVVLWEALTHRRLFGSLSEVQAMLAICDPERRRAPSEVATDLPKALDEIVLRALAVEREDRYESAEAFQTDLLSVLHDLHGPVRRKDVRDVVSVITGLRAPSANTTGSMAALSVDTSSGFIEVPEVRETESQDLPRESFDELATGDALLDPTHRPGELPIAAHRLPTDDIEGVRALVDHTPVDYSDPMDQTLRDDHGIMSPASGIAPTPTVSQGPAPADAALLAADTDPYAGPYAFYVRRAGANSEGPLDFAAAHRRLAEAAEIGRTISISVDDKYWIEAKEYAELTGQDLLAELGAPPTNVTVVGSAAQRRIPTLLAVLARDRATGTLSVAKIDETEELWYELLVHDGKPTRLRTNVPSMQLPNVLVDGGWVSADAMPRLLHTVVEERQALDRIARNEGFATPAPLDVMRARSTAMFQWKDADYTFNADPTLMYGPPVADSVLALLPALVKHALPGARILERLMPRIDVEHEPSWRFAEAVEEMQLDAADRDAAEAFAVSQTLRQAIEARIHERERMMAMALLLIEADLLIEVPSRLRS